MAFGYFDRVKESSTTTGLGSFALAGAVAGFRAFSSVYANADTLHYVIFCPVTLEWEVGYGTWLTGNQLQRTTVLDSSNSGAAVNFGAGTKEVFIQQPASIPSRQGATFFTVSDVTERDSIPAKTLRLGQIVRLLSDGSFHHWTGSAWVTFIGFAPTGSATGQTQIWNGSAWAAGALDLADPDSHTGVLSPTNGGTGIAGAGGTPNRVLLTTDGSSWGAGLVDLATMVTGTLAAAALGAALATSVYGRSVNSSGSRADIQATVDGHTFRRAGGVLGFGALDLADPDAVTGLLPGTNVDPVFGTRDVSSTGTLSIGKTTITPLVETSGSPYALRVTGAAHTTLAASTQAVDLDFNLSRTVQFATGALAAQRAARIQAPTYAFVGASVLSEAATLAISSAPVAGTNATITKPYALWVEAGVSRFVGAIAAGTGAQPTTGAIRLSHGSLVTGLNNAGLADKTVLDWGVTATDSLHIGDSTTSMALDATSSGVGFNIRLGGNNRFTLSSTQATWYVSNALFAVSQTSPVIGQEDDPASGAVGRAMVLHSQDAIHATLGTGAALTIRSGTGPTAAGNLLLQRGSTTVAQWTNSTSDFLALGTLGSTIPTTGAIRLANAMAIVGRTTTGSDGQMLVLNNGDAVILGNATLSTVINGPAGATAIRFLSSGSDVFRVGSQLTFLVDTLQWGSSQVSAVISQAVTPAANGAAMSVTAQGTTVNGGTGGSLTLTAGSSSGVSGTRTGGAAVFGSGVGTTADGDLSLKRGSLIGVQLVNPSGGLVVGLASTSVITSTQMPASTGDKVVFLGNAVTAPTANPVNGLIVYSNAGYFVTRSPTDGKMHLGATNVSMVFTAQSGAGKGFLWQIGGTDALEYLDYTTGLNFKGTNLVQTGISVNDTPVMWFSERSSSANASFFNSNPAWNSGDGILYVGDKATVPTSDPASGFYMYSSAGQLVVHDANGVVTIL